jgi:hypothetical protein
VNSPDVWVPYLITHILTLLLIFTCYKWPSFGKAVWGLILILAGAFNIFTVISSPEKYVSAYGQHAVLLYKKIIFGLFSTYAVLFVVAIAMGQILVGSCLLMKRTPFKLGVFGGVIFLVAISPLGLGAAFPSTLFMALSPVLMYVRYQKSIDPNSFQKSFWQSSKGGPNA